MERLREALLVVGVRGRKLHVGFVVGPIVVSFFEDV